MALDGGVEKADAPTGREEACETTLEDERTWLKLNFSECSSSDWGVGDEGVDDKSSPRARLSMNISWLTRSASRLLDSSTSSAGMGMSRVNVFDGPGGGAMNGGACLSVDVGEVDDDLGSCYRGHQIRCNEPRRTYDFSSLGRRVRGPVLKTHSRLDSEHLVTGEWHVSLEGLSRKEILLGSFTFYIFPADC